MRRLNTRILKGREFNGNKVVFVSILEIQFHILWDKNGHWSVVVLYITGKLLLTEILNVSTICNYFQKDLLHKWLKLLDIYCILVIYKWYLVNPVYSGHALRQTPLHIHSLHLFQEQMISIPGQVLFSLNLTIVDNGLFFLSNRCSRL